VIDPQLTEEAPVVTPRTLRQFTVLVIVFLGGLVTWHRFTGNPRPSDSVLLAIAAIVGALGLSRPESIRPIFSGLLFVTTPIGRIVSSLVLVVLFYGVFTPLAAIQRLLGRDVLFVSRPNRPSHWTPKAKTTDVTDYTRQS
jgi:hypothetical protein